MGKIEFTCPNSECSTRLKASDDKAGSKIKCPACGTVGSVPENSGTAIESLMRDKGAGLSSWKREGELARGGMGEVIRGQDRILSRPLAMKVMRQQIADSEEHRLRFLEEARITGQLEHPNIVPIHELGKDPDGNFYFTMKLVKGRSLGQVLRDMVNGSDEEKPDGLPPSRQPLTINHLLGIFLKVCDAIAFAHSKGVIHRDLKPDNIMIGNFGEVLVMDWGLAKVVATGSLPVGSEKINVQRSDADAARASDTAPASSVENPASSGEPQVSSIRADTDIAVTVEGAIQGTPAYMPPEQAEGDLSKIDHRSDIYSLGAILYEILTLRRPFEGKTVHDVLLRVVEGRVLTPEKRAPDRDIPAELAAVAMKAMSKSRLKRYQSVVELSQDINLYLEGRGVSAKEDSFVESFSKLIRRNKAVSIAVGVAVSVLFLMGGVFTWDNAHKRKTAEDAFAQVVVEQRAAEKARANQKESATAASLLFAQRAVSDATQGRWQEAEKNARHAKRVDPGGQWGSFTQARFLQLRNDHEGAARLLEKLVKAHPQNEQVRSALEISRKYLADVAAAREFMKSVGNVSDWKEMMAMGKRLYWIDKREEANSLFDAAQKLIADDKNLLSGPRKEAETIVRIYLSNIRAWDLCQGFDHTLPLIQAKQRRVKLEEKMQETHGRKIRIWQAAFESGKLIVCAFHQNQRIEQLVPLRGFRSLQRIALPGKSHLIDLRPLKGLALQELELDSPYLSDLTVLRGMPLEVLKFSGPVTNLEPLRGMKLKRLQLSDSPGLTDLTPIERMPLRVLHLRNCGIEDLTPLKGKELFKVIFFTTPVAHLRPFKGMPIEEIDCYRTEVRDLSPLKGTPLRRLNLSSSPVKDLSPLKGLPLENFAARNTEITNLAPLEGMPLSYVDVEGTKVSDIGPLKGAPLAFLNVMKTKVRDLTPIAEMPLEKLYIDDISKYPALSVAVVQKHKTNGCEVTAK